MLYITSVQPTGMFSYGPCEQIRLNENRLVHLVGINEDKNGDSNGSGKTSLFNSICRVLFGEDPTGVKDSDVPNVLLRKGSAGRVEFVSWENIYYRVTDCRDWKDKDYYPADNDNQVLYKGSQLFFDRWDGSRWVDTRSESRASTRKEIIKAIGMTYNRFLSISYLTNRTGNRFLRGGNQDRLDVLSGVSGVEDWDKKLIEIKEKRTPLNQKVVSIYADISYKEGQLSVLMKQLASIINTDWLSLIQKTESDLRSLAKDIEALQQILESTQTRYNLILGEVNKVNPEEAELSKKKDQLSQNQASLRSKVDLPLVETNELKAIKTEIDKLQGLRSSYSSEIGLSKLKECPTCGHKITKAQKDKISKKVSEVDNNIRSKESQYNGLLAKLQKVHEDNRTDVLGKIVSIKKEISKIDQQLQKLQEGKAEDSQRLNKVIQEYNQVQSDLNIKNSEKYNLERNLSDYKNKHEEQDRATLSVNEANKEIETLKEEAKAIMDKVSIYDWFVNNIPYIKLHKLSLMMKTISDKTNKYFEEMGESIRIDISPFKEKSKKKATDLRELLKGEVNVELTDGDKNIDTRLYSDGETAKISNALIRALHDVSCSYGHGCNLVLLDEIFSFVDNSNSQKIAESFRSNLSGMVLVTDNSGAVNNLMTFDETWTVRKRNGITRLEK